MSREKQIEEMAEVISKVPPIVYPLGDRRRGKHFYTIKHIAEHIYNAGYRKTEDVAEEIFAEIETSLQIENFTGGEVYYAIRAEDYLTYKKKYTEEENCGR